MGRKPNQIILEYFERGQKLDDASNRYQHTCRSCGEHFLKGRIETLVSHLIHKCSVLPQAEREVAVARLEEAKRRPAPPARIFSSSQPSDQLALRGLEYHPTPNMSALETLAEVSRRQLHHNVSQANTARPSKRPRTGPGSEVQQMNSSFSEFVVEDPHMTGGDAHDEATNHLLRDLQEYNASHGNTTHSLESMTDMLQPTNQQLHPFRLHEAAWDGASTNASSNAPPRLQSRTDEVESIDPQLQIEDGSLQLPTVQREPQEQVLSSSRQEVDLSRADISSHANRAEPPRHLFHDFAILSPGVDAPKRRRRFSESRRKEVSAIRKQGACIRCRMLKKPCSGETPCSTCEAVNTARLWKTPCLRTKLVDALDLYQARVHIDDAARRTEEFRGRAHQAGVPLETTHLSATHFPGDKTAPLLLRVKMIPGAAGSTYRIETTDAAQDALQEYIASSGDALVEHETSKIMRETLRMSRRLARDAGDVNLNEVLRLWAGNQFLLDAHAPWNLTLCHAEQEKAGGSEASAADSDGGRSRSKSAQLSADDPLHDLFSAQLKSLLEVQCARRARSVMSELERRLIQRAQASSKHFETFLASMVLLNCCERFCSILSTWPGKWTCEKPAVELLQQAGKVADVLSSLLIIRGLPPATQADGQGILRLSESKFGTTIDEKQMVAAEWLDAAQIMVNELQARASGQTGRGVCGWDGRWMSRSLLPSGAGE